MRKLIWIAIFFSSQQLFAQNVGIGNNSPKAPLHVTGTSEVLRVDGTSPYIQFVDGTTQTGVVWGNKNWFEFRSQNNAPMIFSNAIRDIAFFMPNGNVGIGKDAPVERLDVAGGVNFTGVLKVNNNAGLPGQVLTSNGNAAPTWNNTAHTNNIRFAFPFTQANLATVSGFANFGAHYYNLNSNVVAPEPDGIRIFRSGLYHIDIQASGEVTYSTARSTFPEIFLWLDIENSEPLRFIDNRVMRATSTANLRFRTDDMVSFEIYLTAPVKLRLYHGLVPFGTTPYQVAGRISGHLISD